MELPEDWEAIDLKTMPLPESEKDTSDESYLPSSTKPETKSKRKKNKRRKRRYETKRQRRKKLKRRSRRNSNVSQSLSSFMKQQDCTIERKPVFTQHAKQRIQQGRSGNFVTRKQGNAVVVITVLPSHGEPRKEIESIHSNRKQVPPKYKIR